MKAKKKILALVLGLCLLFGCVFAFTFTANAECTEHKDVGGDGLCDDCSVMIDGCSGLGGYAVDLAKNITLKFYMSVNTTVTKDIKACFEASVNGRTTQIDLIDAEFVNGYYVVPVEIAAKELTSAVSVRLLYSDVDTTVYTYSVKQYCDAILANPTEVTYAPYVELAKALLNYGGYAQKYFNFNTDALANAGLYTDSTDPVVTKALPQKNISTSGSLPTGVVHKMVTLVLESDITIRHYFAIDGAKNVSDYTFTANGKTVTPVKIGDLYAVDVAGITPRQIDREFTVTVSDGTATYNASYSALTYASRKSNGSRTLVDLLRAMAIYNDAADALPAVIYYEISGNTVTRVTGLADNKSGDTALTLPMMASKTGYAFDGWYKNADFSDKLETVAADDDGCYAVYGRYRYTFLNNDGSNFNGMSPAGGGFDAVHVEGEIDATRTIVTEGGNSYILFTRGYHPTTGSSSDALFNCTNSNTQNHTYANMITADETITISIDLMLPSGWRAPSSNFRFFDLYDSAQTRKKGIAIFTINSNGSVTLMGAGGPSIIELSDTFQTVNISVDFKNGLATAFTNEGDIIATSPFTPPSDADRGNPTTSEWREHLTEYLFNWNTSGAHLSAKPEANEGFAFDNLKIIEGKHPGLATKQATLDKEYREKRLNELAAANDAFKDDDFGVTSDWLTKYSMPTNVYEPSMSITEQHPRVLLTKDTIPKMKALLNDPEYANMANKLWSYASVTNFTGIFPEKTHSTGETYRYDGTILAQIEAKAMAYLLTGDEIYGREAIVGIKNAMLSYKFTTENHMDVYHGPSHIMVILSEVYDWCYDLLSERDKAQLISGCVYLLIEAKHFTDDDFVLDSNKPSLKPTLNTSSKSDYGLEFNFPPNNMNAINGHGTGPQFLRDYMMVTVAFADEMPSWWDYVGGRFYQEYLPAAKEIYRNGYVTQGTSCYAPIKLHVNLVPAYLLKMSTGVNPYPDYMGECANFMLSHLMPNGKMFETGDGPRSGSGVGVVYAYFYYLAAMYNDTFSLQAAKYYSNNFQTFQTDSIYTNGPAAALALCAACDKATGVFPDDMPLYTYTTTPAGQTTARNSWDDDAAVAFMKVGEITMANHDLIDSGSFQIYYKGFLAVTSGNYGKYGSLHHGNYLQKTISANGLLIYNPALKNTCSGWYTGSQESVPGYSTLEQWQTDTYKIGKVIGVENVSGEYSYLAGDITKSYNASTIDYVGRRMLTVFTGDEDAPMAFFVFDNITSDGADFKKTFLLHTVKEPTIAGTATDKPFTVTPDADGKMTATIVNGEGAMVLQNVYGGDYMHKVGGDGFAYWIGNENEFDGTANSGFNGVDQYNPSDNANKIWGRIEVTTRGEKVSEMLNVMYVTDSGAIKQIPAILVENTAKTLVGATLDGITAMFVKQTSRSTDTFTFTTSGEGEMKYFISGLRHGTWNVSINGGTAQSYSVTEEGGMLQFEGACGTVNVTPGDDVIVAGRATIDYHLSGATLPADAQDTYEIGKGYTLPTLPSSATNFFEGWYTDANYTTKITAIPTTATGTFSVYAKFKTLDVYIDRDYSKPGTSALSRNDGSSVTSLAVDSENGCLVWEISDGMAKIFNNGGAKISDIDDESNALTYVLTLSKKPGVTLANAKFDFQVSQSSTGKNYGAITLLQTKTDGGVYLANSSTKLVTLGDDGKAVTIRLVIDLDAGSYKRKGVITAYDESGNKLGETILSTTTAAQSDGVTTLLGFSKYLSTYNAWWVCTASDTVALRIHKIWGAEGIHLN